MPSQKYKFHLAILLIPLIPFIVSTCEYEPDNEYFKKVEPKDPIPVNVEIDQNDSLVYLWKSTLVSYKITPLDVEVKSADVYLNNKLIGTLKSNTGYFTIDPYQLNDGEYPLQLDLYVGSGSGSLADKFDGEIYNWQKDFVLKVDRTAAQCSITHIGIDNGRLRIDWDIYPKGNFTKYILDDFNLLTPTIEISIIGTTSFYDNRFIGGGGFYTFRVEAAGNSSTPQYYPFEFPYPQPREFKTEDDNSLTVKWNKCLFYSNFQQYLVTSFQYSGNEIEYFSSYNIDDTTANITGFPFGKRTFYYLTTRSKAEDVKAVELGNVFVGDTAFPYITGMAYCPYPHEYIYYNYNELNKYSTEDLQNTIVLGSTYFLSRFTEVEKYLLTLNMSNGNLTLFTMPEQEIAGTLFFDHLPIDYAISETGKAVVLTNDSLLVYDFISKGILKIPIPNTNYSNFRVYISADGKHVYLDNPSFNDKLYIIEDDQAYERNMPVATFSGFNPFNAGEFLTFANNMLNVYSFNTLSIIRTYPLPGPPFSNIDPVSGYFMATESSVSEDVSSFGIYNIQNGQKVWQFNATTKKQFEYSDRPLSYMIFNKIIYSPYGYKLKIID